MSAALLSVREGSACNVNSHSLGPVQLAPVRFGSSARLCSACSVNEPLRCVLCNLPRRDPGKLPGITDDLSAVFDPSMYNGHQSVWGSVRNGNGKRVVGFALNTTKHPRPLNRVAPTIFFFFEEMKPNFYLFDKMYAH